MPQFFIEAIPHIGNIVALRGADAKHISAVLRLKTGDRLVVSSGDGKSYESEIISSSKQEVTVRILAERTSKRHSPLTLAQAIIKHDRTEWIIQKAVELGVTTIIPFASARTIPKFAEEDIDRKLNRWNEIAIAAAKQSGLPVLPSVKPPLTLASLLKTFPDYSTCLVFWEQEKQTSVRSVMSSSLSNPLIVIGPEGGFSPEEILEAKASHAITVSLGEHILRVETAALAALAICQYERGNLA